jgi:hypothetical protein
LDTDTRSSLSIILPRRGLVDAVQAAAHAEHITITATSQQCCIAAADMWLTVATTMDVLSAPTSFSVTVPTRQLVAELKGLPDGDVEITATQSQLKLRSGKRIATLTSEGRACEIRAIATALWQTLDIAYAGDLAAALSSVASAATRDEARPAVSGVRLIAGSTGCAVATDGARLHRRDVALPWLSRDVTLPNRVISLITGLLHVPVVKSKSKAKNSPEIAQPSSFTTHVAVGANNIALRRSDGVTTCTLYARLAPEPFVEWRRIVDAATQPCVATVSAPALATWLRSCPGGLVTLTPEADALRLDYQVLDETGLRLLGEGCDTIETTKAPTPSANPAPPIKVSVAYLRDALSNLSGDVHLHWAAGQPLSIRSDGWRAVVMFSR